MKRYFQTFVSVTCLTCVSSALEAQQSAPALTFPPNYAPSSSLLRAVSGFVPVDSSVLEQRYKIIEERYDPAKRQYLWLLKRKVKKAAATEQDSYVAEFVSRDGVALYKAPMLFSSLGEGSDGVVAVTQSMPDAESINSYKSMRVMQY